MGFNIIRESIEVSLSLRSEHCVANRSRRLEFQLTLLTSITIAWILYFLHFVNVLIYRLLFWYDLCGP